MAEPEAGRRELGPLKLVAPETLWGLRRRAEPRGLVRLGMWWKFYLQGKTPSRTHRLTSARTYRPSPGGTVIRRRKCLQKRVLQFVNARVDQALPGRNALDHHDLPCFKQVVPGRRWPGRSNPQ